MHKAFIFSFSVFLVMHSITASADALFFDNKMKPVTVNEILADNQKKKHADNIEAPRNQGGTNYIHGGEKPNILLIQVDDLGFEDLAVHGNTQVHTPSLDALAEESVRFEHFYVSSLCAPSRASLLTGRHFLRTGVSGVHAGRDHIHLSETLVSELLSKNGYRTGMWGKWHSGKSNGYFPWDRGFDEAYYATLYNYFDNRGLLNGHPVSTKGFATNAITRMAIDFIERHNTRPFFAYVSYLAPHNPWRAPEEKIRKYQEQGLSFAAASLYGMIDNLDENIGRLLNTLDTQGLSENTIVIFLSDNGPWIKSYRFGMNNEEWALRNPSGRRGMKSQNWENGIRSPLFIRWRGHDEPTTSKKLASVEDIFPTLLDWAGIARPTDLALDGQSLVSSITKPNSDNGHTDSRQVFIASASPLVPTQTHPPEDKTGFYRPLTKSYREHIKFEPQRLAIRQGEIKFVRNEAGSGQHALYDLAVDPNEKNNLLINGQPEHSAIAKVMNEALEHWYSDILSSPHSMTMPQFQIGYEGRIYSQINAYAPTILTHDLFNKDHFLANWVRKGQWAEYRVNVHAPDRYHVYLISKMRQPACHTFAVSAENSQAEARLGETRQRPVGTLIRNESAYWENFDHFDTFKSDIQNSYLGTLPLSKREKSLRLTLTAIDDACDTKPEDQVIAIQLIRASEDKGT